VLSSRARAFSSTVTRFGAGETDAALSAKLQEELLYEQDAASAEGGQLPEWLEEFQNNGTWKIVDKAGNDEVSLERHFGGEKIRITFSISDLDNPPDTSDLAPTADPSGASEEPLMDEDADETSFPVRCSLYITKPSSSGSAGALVMDLLVENETFVIDNISFYKDEKVAEDMTAEGDWKRRGIYIGPRFDHLDATVQSEFENFLEERDINEALASFIPLYCEYKEQKEYVTWLGNVKTFIDQ
jgi:complement component 1 Q subcomponent-binding protein